MGQNRYAGLSSRVFTIGYRPPLPRLAIRTGMNVQGHRYAYLCASLGWLPWLLPHRWPVKGARPSRGCVGAVWVLSIFVPVGEALTCLLTGLRSYKGDSAAMQPLLASRPLWRCVVSASQRRASAWAETAQESHRPIAIDRGTAADRVYFPSLPAIPPCSLPHTAPRGGMGRGAGAAPNAPHP